MIALLCAHNFVNCRAVICLPIMHIFWRDTTSDMWTPVLFSYTVSTVLIAFYHCLLAGHILLSSYFTSARLILCVQQAGEIDNLSVSLGQINFFVIVCRSMSTRHNLFLAPLTPSKAFSKSYWFDNLGFVIKGNCCFAASYLPLGIPQRTCDPRHQWLPDDLLTVQQVELFVECRIAIPHLILSKLSLWKPKVQVSLRKY